VSFRTPWSRAGTYPRNVAQTTDGHFDIGTARLGWPPASTRLSRCNPLISLALTPVFN
jgi:hypothetical protein